MNLTRSFRGARKPSSQAHVVVMAAEHDRFVCPDPVGARENTDHVAHRSPLHGKALRVVDHRASQWARSWCKVTIDIRRDPVEIPGLEKGGHLIPPHPEDRNPMILD